MKLEIRIFKELIELIVSNPKGMAYSAKPSVTPSEFAQHHVEIYNHFTPSAL